MMTTADFLRPIFLEEMMRAHAPARQIRVLAVAPLALDSSASILTALTAGQTDAAIGHFGLAVTLEADGRRQTQRLVLKVKPPGREISAMLASLAQACGEPLATVYPQFAARTGFHHTHRRELAAYQLPIAGLMPTIWGVYADDARQAYCVLMEYLDDVTLLNSVMAPEAWTDAHIRAALTQLAAWHAAHLTPSPPHGFDDQPSLAHMRQLAPLWEALLANAAAHFPDLYTAARQRTLRTAIAQIPAYWAVLETMPRTLIHNDLNPRNTCFKTSPDGLRLCAYDWELATWHVPQYDVVELLSFVLGPDRYGLRLGYLEHYRQVLHGLTGHYADAAAFRAGAGYAALDFGLHRLGMYLMAHSVSPYPFLPRVVDSYFDTLAQLRPLELPGALPEPRRASEIVREKCQPEALIVS
ncbi:aminoglycoside phosphotransferase family protein [Hymenobacter antarcticus]